MNTYPIIHNTIPMGEPTEKMSRIMQAVQSVESGLIKDADLIAAVDDLEATLDEYAESDAAHAIETCREAEQAVLDAYTPEIEAAVDENIKAGYRD